MMRRPKPKPTTDAAQPDDSSGWVTIVFPQSPFCGQSARVLKESLGVHSDLHLELSDGRRIKIDMIWTDYAKIVDSDRQRPATHSIDLTRAVLVLYLIKYLKNKQSKAGCVSEQAISAKKAT
jgi:hypothetical protein